jgi:hypothetical protein
VGGIDGAGAGAASAHAADAGVPDALAHRAYLFTQVAWGRAILADLGVEFSPEYVCFDASGEVVESGRLADEPCFAAASRLAGRYAGTPGFKRLALLSADVDCVNKHLQGGSRPEDLVTGKVFLILEELTAAREDMDQRLIDYVDSLMGAGFTVHNPNAVHSCSCGSSFDTGDDAGEAKACGCGH